MSKSIGELAQELSRLPKEEQEAAIERLPEDDRVIIRLLIQTHESVIKHHERNQK